MLYVKTKKTNKNRKGFDRKTKQKIENASKYYAHNYFDMHETNSYKELKRGFEAGAEWAIKNIKLK